MIPKKIHYCWFGGSPLSDLNKKCIESWQKFCPDYEIIEWNEKNFDLQCCSYVKEAYDAKKWAFVSDYARLHTIYKYGGIYLDTDVEIIKPIDKLLNNECFLGTEKLGIINTGLGFGAEPNNKCIELLLEEYKNLHFKIDNNLYDLTPCPIRNTKPFISLGFNNKNDIQEIEGAYIYPVDYFCPLDYETKDLKITENTIFIHHFNASWISKEEKKMQKKIILFEKKHGKIATFIYKNYCEYRLTYKSCRFKFVREFIRNKIKRKLYKIRYNF
ncbi:MAG: Eps7I [Clostridium butyricum DORA_1]|nr:MAG: Eps7I [Clostridium butyricum DORA_1]